MARRAAPSASAPALPEKQRRLNDANTSSFSRFMRDQVWAPEKLPGNISILTGVGVFIGGIVVVRTWGELMIPA